MTMMLYPRFTKQELVDRKSTQLRRADFFHESNQPIDLRQLTLYSLDGPDNTSGFFGYAYDISHFFPVQIPPGLYSHEIVTVEEKRVAKLYIQR
jgi:hypothetical protein